MVFLPVSRVRILASSLARRYVGDLMVDMMGHMGISSLWTLGSPYI